MNLRAVISALRAFKTKDVKADEFTLPSRVLQNAWRDMLHRIDSADTSESLASSVNVALGWIEALRQAKVVDFDKASVLHEVRDMAFQRVLLRIKADA
ncbi:hypothetical protein [Pseudomonas sp. PSPC3-3]|uniref:hypothetical protein n=1 Tax=unclassified Pseudomonas TaxID=196821 RepID=UPI003CF98F49